jgi:hypothetical protein
LRRLLLTEGVVHTLFEEFAAHRSGHRGDEETGWILLGLRDLDEAIAVATLPAGAERSAGESHVRFNCEAQALGSRIVRQRDRRLTMLGVVHTHPGSLRHPSDGDFRGDSQWVGQLRGQEGAFGIGTADGGPSSTRAHVLAQGALCFSWYALAEGDSKYRSLPVEQTLGPDLARPLHGVWSAVEGHAERLERLYRQQAGMTCDVADGREGPALSVAVPLAEPGAAIRVLLEGKTVRYLLAGPGEVLVADPQTSCIDQGVYLLLAQLAAQADA